MTGALTASTCETITGPITKYYLNWGPVELARLLVGCGLTSVSGYASLKSVMRLCDEYYLLFIAAFMIGLATVVLSALLSVADHGCEN